jgi:hypothetical protein
VRTLRVDADQPTFERVVVVIVADVSHVRMMRA